MSRRIDSRSLAHLSIIHAAGLLMAWLLVRYTSPSLTDHPFDVPFLWAALLAWIFSGWLASIVCYRHFGRLLPALLLMLLGWFGLAVALVEAGRHD